MTDRVNEYYGHPVTKRLENHMIHEIGLSERDKKLVQDLRNNFGDTQFFADKAGMPKAKYSRVIGNIHRAEMRELMRLAEIGLAYEDSKK